MVSFSIRDSACHFYMPMVLMLMTLVRVNSAVGAQTGPLYTVDQSPAKPSPSDYMLIVTRLLTQYVLWWLTDLLILVVWKRKSWKVWIHKAMRKILLQWRPGIMFVMTCEPKGAEEAYRLLGDDGGPISNTSLVITLLVDLFTIAGGGVSLYQITNHQITDNGLGVLKIFFAPVPPAIISFFSTLTVMLKARNRTRIILISLGLVAWPAIMLPLMIGNSDLWILELISWVFCINPFVLVRAEYAVVLFIAFQRLFEILIYIASNPATSGFPFPALATWAFGGPLLVFGLAITVFAEVALYVAYKDILMYYAKLKSRWGNVLRGKKNMAEPPLALPMHTVLSDPSVLTESVPGLQDEKEEVLEDKDNQTIELQQEQASRLSTQSSASVPISTQTQAVRQTQSTAPISRRREESAQPPIPIARQVQTPNMDQMWNQMFAQRQPDGSRPNETSFRNS